MKLDGWEKYFSNCLSDFLRKHGIHILIQIHAIAKWCCKAQVAWALMRFTKIRHIIIGGLRLFSIFYTLWTWLLLQQCMVWCLRKCLIIEFVTHKNVWVHEWEPSLIQELKNVSFLGTPLRKKDKNVIIMSWVN